MRLPIHTLRSAFEDVGLRVVRNPNGADKRGKEMAGINAIILHDTVTTRSWKPDAVWNLLTNGREGLPGPLCQYSVDRDGVVWIVADGKGNHNGYGQHGNNSIGIEVQCAGGLKGHEEPWNEKQYATVLKMVRVLRRWYPVPVLGHRESDPGRKIDPYKIDLVKFRRELTVTPPPQQEEFVMASQEEVRRLVREELSPIAALVIRTAVKEAFELRGVPIRTENETAGQRVERIAREVETGKRSWAGFIATLDHLAEHQH